MRSLDIPNPGLHSQLASVYEPQLEHAYHGEISRRLTDNREYIRLGAWHCLVHLADNQIEWAQELAEKNWPSDLEEQLKVMGQGFPFYRSRWITRKFLQVAPQIPVSRVPDLYRVGPGELPGLLPEEEALLKVFEAPRHEKGVQVSFLQTGLNLPALQMSEGGSSWIREIEDLEDCHPSWAIYKSAAAFLQNPSKEKLAGTLEAIAPFVGNGIDLGALRWRTVIPWPIQACLEMCTEESHLGGLADKVAAGLLGDASDWLAAENRWIEKGIAAEDILSMSDDRLPFDAEIATSGFPIALPFWPMTVHSDEPSLLSNLLKIHSQLPKCKSRSFVARILDMCLFHASLSLSTSKLMASAKLSTQGLLSIYEDLEPGQILPLSVVIEQVSGSNEEVIGFFSTLASRGHRFHSYLYRQPLNPDHVERLLRVFQEVGDNAVLLPVIGCLAEHGYLAGHPLNVPSLEQLESSEHKVAALLAMLAKESWETDNTQRFLELTQGLSQLSDGVHERVIGTIRENRPNGSFLNKFLVGFETTLPRDSYGTRMQYVHLLEDYLRRRISQFSDPRKFSDFDLPQGAVELLEADPKTPKG